MVLGGYSFAMSTVEPKRKNKPSYMTSPSVYSMAGSITFPFSSTAFDILKHVRIEAIAIQAASIAKCRPGQILVILRVSITKVAVLSISYRRPNPKAPTIAGSGGSCFPFSFMKRSGLNLNGSGYAVSSWRMALRYG